MQISQASMMFPNKNSVAYFSMEIALAPEIPTYSGGLGMLSGDTIRSAADLKIPMVAVSLLHRKGYFTQGIDSEGRQFEQPAAWEVESKLVELPQRVNVLIENRTVHLRAWKYEVIGCFGFRVPVILLDSHLPENSEWDRSLTDHLYGGDQHYRLCQEVILGIGGVKMLRALGYSNLQTFHMNEGHASLLTLELLDERLRQSGQSILTDADVETVHDQCVFTTHTPVPAGHDQFPMDLVSRVLGDRDVYGMKNIFCCEGKLNMTFLAMNLSRYINGVAKRHGEVSQHMFAKYKIDSITNGVHAATWVSPAFQDLFDRRIPGWREDNFNLRYASGIPTDEISQAHQVAKQQLLDEVERLTNETLDPNVFTIGFARRATAYKRPDLLLDDIDRLQKLTDQFGPMQIVYGGKAHPHDDQGKEIIHHVYQSRKSLGEKIRLVYLPNYEMKLGQLMTSGVDLWLNTPEPPLEASGTSGMKAALNGVPSLSILDGWWIEGCTEGVTGWAIGEDDHQQHATDRCEDANSLYDKLEHVIFPLYLQVTQDYAEVMRHAISLNGSFFNTQRMMQQYVVKAYF
ncbi:MULTISPECIES: alpha-glucan family phosphorylase [Thalassoglobus]|nr:alpha-glucan family phosphorylase [Thalassoglobus polymorphus]